MARGGRFSSGSRSGRSCGASGRKSSHSSSRSSGGRSYSAKTKSYVSGKIAGQYRAKGYSKSHAQYIGNSVVRKMGATFKSGKGSRSSYVAGSAAGYYSSSVGEKRAEHIGNESAYGASSGKGKKSHGKSWKSYGKDYSKKYR